MRHTTIAVALLWVYGTITWARGIPAAFHQQEARDESRSPVYYFGDLSDLTTSEVLLQSWPSEVIVNAAIESVSESESGGAEKRSSSLSSKQMTNGELMRRGQRLKKPSKLWSPEHKVALAPRWSGSPSKDSQMRYSFTGLCYAPTSGGFQYDCVEGATKCTAPALGTNGQYGTRASQTPAQKLAALDACVAICVNTNGGPTVNMLIGFFFDTGTMACLCGYDGSGTNVAVTTCTNENFNYAKYLRS